MKNIKKLLALTLVVAAFMTVIPSSVAETYSTKYITASSGSTVNFRKSATTKSAIIARIPIHTEVQAASYNTKWSKVKYNGTTGYIMSEYLTSTAPWIEKYGSATIYHGSRSTYVYVVQVTLYTLGYITNGFEDNYCDDITWYGIQDFQRDHGLTADGIVGSNTKRALYNAWVNRSGS